MNRLLALDNILVRELMNGMWFVLSVEILVALIVYIGRRAFRTPTPQHEWDDAWIAERWYNELGTQLALSWATYMAGSTIRAGWIWILLECQGRVGMANCGYVTQTVWILYVACVFAIVGGVCTIRIMLPEVWRPWSYLIPAAIAISVPLIVHAM